MDRALVVIDDTESHRQLLAEAAAFAQADGADLVAFAWTTPEAAEERIDALEWVEKVERTTYEETDPDAMTRQFAREFVDDVIGDDGDVRIETVIAEDGDLDDAILSAADRLDCDHVFLVGRKRSPTGKAIFGDVAQRILLNFDGLVTVRMR
ncbi:universal stress protein [Halosolutus gelatinilyticus]|uniref:universal stress protein n=1 Tax=Halosolutus gelatinilyticus TaxID=2931975 RepID=UPI001FF505BA|nr:universal stress protein [Halosolutus gelatinilyticus]